MLNTIKLFSAASLKKPPTPRIRNRDKVDQEIGDYYAACMDEKGIEQRGLAPLHHYADDLAAVQDKKDLAAFVAAQHLEGTVMFFGFGSGADAQDSRHEIANIAQGGLGQPERDYYLRTYPKSVELRNAYQAHVKKMFSLVSFPDDVATAKAQAVMNIETTLAKVAMDRVSMRNPNSRYHKLPVGELSKLAPDFDWKAYFAALKTPAFDELNITAPTYIQGLEDVV